MSTNPEIARRMRDARTALVLDHPFFGHLALRLALIEDSNKAGGTAATDGRAIYYCPTFVASLPQAQLVGLMAHEVLHPALGHTQRRGMREHQRWNVACDYPINSMVLGAGMQLPPDGCVDAELGKLSAEEVYPLLPDDEPEVSGGCGRWGGVLDAPSGDDAAEWQVAVVQAAKAARAMGKCPKSAERLLGELLAPKVDWREALRRFVTERAKSEYSWARPNRRHLANGLILPGLYSWQLGAVAVAIDTSGSIGGPELDTFAAELRGVHEDARPSSLAVLYCDAKVHRVDEFTPCDRVELRAEGGGGTDFRPVFDAIAERDEEPACLIYLTDGYGEFPDCAPSYPVLWVMTTEAEAPFGEVVRLGA
jgi:predicted metal-dependent peptidase